MSEVETAFDLCSICRKQGTDGCKGCDIPLSYIINNFQPDKNKVIVNPKVKLYAHWVNCLGEECPEAEGKRCRQAFERVNHETGERLFTYDFVDFPKNGKCLSPAYFTYSAIDENSPGFEKVQEGEIEDTPF